MTYVTTYELKVILCCFQVDNIVIDGHVPYRVVTL